MKSPSSSNELRATLHDVAARARVSIATVSRALNGLPVSPDSHKRVQKAVAELGYVANHAARALRSQSSHTMGLIFFDLRTTVGIELLDSLSEAIEDAGYSLLISTARGDAGRFEVLMHRFLERRVDALFCIQARGDAETLARYRAADIPVLAAIASEGGFAELPLIRPSISDAAASLAQHLQTFRHEHVALIPDRAYRAHANTLVETLNSHGMRVEELPASEVGGMSELLASLMSRSKRPTVVIAAAAQAQALLSACDAAGVRVPEQLSLVSLSRLGDPRHEAERAMSYLAIDPHRVGRAAGSAMLGCLAGVRPPTKLRVQCATFVVRHTTGAIAKR